MAEEINSARNWFEQGGQAYARFRPEYTQQLATYLSEVSPHSPAPFKRIAIDVGCGNGQLTQLLAQHFDAVFGFDQSADQIANSVPHEKISYACAPAERLPMEDGCASLITAAQAAHWFNLPALYQEVKRVAAPKAVLSLISYGVLQLEPELNDRFLQFYWDEIGPFWPPERKLVDSGYTTLEFPFNELIPPSLEITVHWQLNEFLGYLQTWSAVRNAHESGQERLLCDFADDISALWGDSDITRRISWPINMRIGRIS